MSAISEIAKRAAKALKRTKRQSDDEPFGHTAIDSKSAQDAASKKRVEPDALELPWETFSQQHREYEQHRQYWEHQYRTKALRDKDRAKRGKK